MKIKKYNTYIYGALTFFVLLLLWQIAVFFSTSQIDFPTPLDVFKRFFYMLFNEVGKYSIWGHIAWSLGRVLIGFLLAFVIGTSLGLLMGWFKVARAIFKPIFDLLRPIAPLAWIPLSILWFGIGESYKYFLIFIAAFVPFTINSYAGVLSCDKVLIGAAKMLGASNSQLFYKVVIPSAVPSIFSGAQVALSNAWMTMLAAEMVRSSEGIGWLIIQGQAVNDMTQMIAGMLAIGIVGLLLATGMRRLERRCLIWKEQGK